MPAVPPATPRKKLLASPIACNHFLLSDGPVPGWTRHPGGHVSPLRPL